MASVRLALNRLAPNVLKRQISCAATLRSGGANTVDLANPILSERTSDSLSDALAAKEKGPWTELNKEDKIALYRSTFPLSMREAEAREPELGRIVFGVTIGVSVAVTFFTFLKKYVGPSAPETITQEWRDAQIAKMKLYEMNPITGAGKQ